MKGPTAPTGNLNDQTAGAYSGALGIANAQTGLGAEAMGQGAGYLTDAANRFANPGSLATTDFQPYMNPFTKGVIDPTMQELNRQEQIGNIAVNDRFTKAGSFGGDRQAIANAENRRNFNDQRARVLAQLNSDNFGNAQKMAESDLGRRFGSAQGLQGIGDTFGRAGMQMFDPSNLSSLAGQGFGFADTIAKNNLQAGTLQQQQVQSLIDAAKLQWEQFTNKPIQGLQAITGATNIPQGAGTTQQNPGVLGILGAGIGALGALCDRSRKCDIEEVGVDEVTGLTVYAYRYKADPKSYPKVVGYMADEVEKLYPAAVRKIGSAQVIDFSKLPGASNARAA